MPTPHFIRANPTVQAEQAFSPRKIEGCLAWWDFTDPTNLFTDVGRTTNPTDGQNIYWCLDKSGNEKHLQQATAANQPIFRESKLAAGFPSVEFIEVATANHDWMANAGFGDCVNDAFTVIIGYQINASGTRDFIWGWESSPAVLNSGASGLDSIPCRVFDGVFHDAGWIVDPGTGPVTYVSSAVYDANAATPFVTAYRDKVQHELINTGVNPLANTLADFTVGCLQGFNPQGSDGVVTHVCVYDTAISTADRNAVEEFVAAESNHTI